MTNEEAIKWIEYHIGISDYEKTDDLLKAFEMAIKALEKQDTRKNGRQKMTNEQAIKMLKSKMDGHTDTSYEWTETVRMAIKALEQETCEDCISRQAVLDGVDRYIYKSQSTGTQDDFYSFAELVVKQLPPVTPQQKTGKWIDCSDEGYVECPFCGHATNCEDNIDELHYCFYCGARMEAENGTIWQQGNWVD
jgi:hypothetical protein